MKTLLLDIETTPNLAHVWGLWNANVAINQIVAPTQVLCVAARFMGEDEMHFHSVHHDGREDMLRAVHALMSAADAIITYNGRNFDIKHLNREFLEAGMTPPAPSKQIDLYAVVKRQFKFPSNKLDYVARALGIGAKVAHSGHELWVRCMAGDDAAWEEMRRYNEQDVNLLEELYRRLLPWIPNHPNVALYAGNENPACPNCGSENLRREGHAYTRTGKYQRYQCRDCGTWSQDGSRVAANPIRQVVQ